MTKILRVIMVALPVLTLAACSTPPVTEAQANGPIVTGSRLPQIPNIADPALHLVGDSEMDHTHPASDPLMMQKAWPFVTVSGPHN